MVVITFDLDFTHLSKMIKLVKSLSIFFVSEDINVAINGE